MAAEDTSEWEDWMKSVCASMHELGSLNKGRWGSLHTKNGLRSIHPNRDSDHSNTASYGLVQSMLVALNRCQVQVNLQKHYLVFSGGGDLFPLHEKRRSPCPPHFLHFFLWYTPINVALHIMMMRDSIVSSGGPPTPTGTTFSHVYMWKFPYINKSLGVGLNS